MKKAFTLIELLIVVAIIAILAAIAVPNFLEAQVRAKVSRAKNDQRTMLTAIESYMVDNNKRPPHGLFNRNAQGGLTGPLSTRNVLDPIIVTTPIAYLTSQQSLLDIFGASKYKPEAAKTAANADVWRQGRMHYTNFDSSAVATQQIAEQRFGGLRIVSAGPDQLAFNREMGVEAAPGFFWTVGYDPTNGTVSVGDIWRTPKHGVEMPLFIVQ